MSTGAATDIDIGGNIAAVRQRIAAACDGAPEPQLIAVSKEKPLELVIRGLDSGHSDFGENYVQELCDKADKTADRRDLRWHFIGTLQSNKCRQLAGCPNLAMIHTVPSVKTARKLNAACASLRPDAPLDVMVQVNTSSEESKGGCDPDGATELCGCILKECPQLRLKGLMCIGRYTSPPGTEDFEVLRRTRDRVSEAVGVPDLGLSMGMSHDFEHACKAGATHVRVGSTIFGIRSRGPAFEAAKKAEAEAAAAAAAGAAPSAE
eukprot:TRINITY_DN8547_c0_g1_i1.p1 TRINITY_DN8547_c0_g1~~TRINITY_DN8547_c0_g1_i1.p1  ORF type:complete len:264 (+),score=65.80 TRINITY_DN8547_c0_g1_i1:193-984(+)